MAPIPSTKTRQTLLAACTLLSAILLPTVSWGQATHLDFFSITVNSPSDGNIQSDQVITLREAIEIANGTLPFTELSEAEQQLVVPQRSNSKILFNLPADRTAIELEDVLPALNQVGLIVDGTTQPGYRADMSATAEIAIAVPVVTIRPAEGKEVFRGLTISANDITVRGLNLYGFNASSQITQSTPPADIFISHEPAPSNRDTELPFAGNNRQIAPPANILIEQNWLGLTLNETLPTVPSGFGISVFDSIGTRITRNRIEYHNGSGIITGRQADNLEISENILVGNGLSGMPDAIRMDGSVRDGLIERNLICGNDGSGIFLFKPQGAVTIVDNEIRLNGQRLRRAAVYVMGSDHRVINNRIREQRGGGVTVTAYGKGPNTQSKNNIITSNQFNNLEGLSIDLNARRDRTPQAFQRGDGPNPQRNSHNRRQDTGNGAVNAPQFASSEFFIIDGAVVVSGRADPGSEIQLYRTDGKDEHYGPLMELAATTTTDDNGTFELVLAAVTDGERFSAIATDPIYGTSEPALNVVARSLSKSPTAVATEATPTAIPQCTTPVPQTPPVPPVPPIPPTSPELPAIPESIQLRVPRNVHFGLDQDFISEESARVLDQIADALKNHPSIIVDLHGHTDSRASNAYNQDLARRRAANTRRYLLSKGIGAERMTIRSFGETELLVEETNVTNFARNRRVEIVFTDVRGAEITFFNQEEDLQIEQ